jgi:hypothetical protein
MKINRMGLLIILGLLSPVLVAQVLAGRSKSGWTKSTTARVETSERTIASISMPGKGQGAYLKPGEQIEYKFHSVLGLAEAEHRLYHPSGLKFGKMRVLDEAPASVYDPQRLPSSIRENSWYMPTTLELFRFPKAD